EPPRGGPGEGCTAPARQGGQHPARGVAPVAGGDPCVEGPTRRGQPAILLVRCGGLLEHVVGELGREVGTGPSECRSRIEEFCVHPWYRSDRSAFGTRRPHVTS